jgi:hypothetical protein
MSEHLQIFLLFAWIGLCAYKLIEGLINEFRPEKLRLKSSYQQLVKESLYYCGPIFKEAKIKYYPLCELSYYKSNRKLGCYFSGKKKIVIYYKSHDQGSETERLRQIIDSVLHEARHYYQHMKDPNFKNYDVYNKRFTYFLNPFEKDSRQFAAEHLEDCIKHLKQKGILA